MPNMVANPLTLEMNIKSLPDFDKLSAMLTDLQGRPQEQNPISVALTEIGTVHFARFVFQGTEKLLVITTYDGEFAEYINAFVDRIGEVFDKILAHIEDAPPLPVADNREEFLSYIQSHDLKCVPPFYSAYPELKTLDILTLSRASE